MPSRSPAVKTLWHSSGLVIAQSCTNVELAGRVLSLGGLTVCSSVPRRKQDDGIQYLRTAPRVRICDIRNPNKDPSPLSLHPPSSSSPIRPSSRPGHRGWLVLVQDARVQLGRCQSESSSCMERRGCGDALCASAPRESLPRTVGDG